MVLAYGSRGSDVRILQEALVRFGYDLGPPSVDGIFGPYTLAAVKALQKDGRIKVDGIAGPTTLAMLGLGEAPEAPVSTAGTITGPGKKDSLGLWIGLGLLGWLLFTRR